MKLPNAALRALLSGAFLIPTFASTSSSGTPPQVALGQKHSCAIDTHRTLKCWGQNWDGQVGDGTNLDKIEPTTISLGNDDTKATQIKAGGSHTCAVDNLNVLKCWGNNEHGQVGDDTNENRTEPTTISLVDAGSYATQIELGSYHTCAIDNHNVLQCWGQNYHGQLGDGSTEGKKKPVIISLGDDTDVIHIELGEGHTCAVDDLKNLLCWGANGSGQLGDGTMEDKSNPTTISLGDDTHPKKIELGHFHSCAIDNHNVLKCWGSNSSGQLGDGTNDYKTEPTAVSLSGNDDTIFAIDIALGDRHTCIVDNYNVLKCWGQNLYGQIGDGTKLDKKEPTTISFGGSSSAAQMSLSQFHSCVFNDSHQLFCWGKNYDVQNGVGTENLLPRLVLDGTSIQ